MEYFDYESAARDAGLTPQQLQRLTEAVRHDYPHDAMLYELHVLRACRAIRDGKVSFERAVDQLADAHARP